MVPWVKLSASTAGFLRADCADQAGETRGEMRHIYTKLCRHCQGAPHAGPGRARTTTPNKDSIAKRAPPPALQNAHHWDGLELPKNVVTWAMTTKQQWPPGWRATAPVPDLPRTEVRAHMPPARSSAGGNGGGPSREARGTSAKALRAGLTAGASKAASKRLAGPKRRCATLPRLPPTAVVNSASVGGLPDAGAQRRPAPVSAVAPTQAVQSRRCRQTSDSNRA